MENTVVRRSLDKNWNGSPVSIHEGTANGVLKTSERAKCTQATDGKEPAVGSRALWIVFISLVVDLLAFTVILPLLPSLLEFYGNKEVRPFPDSFMMECRCAVRKPNRPLHFDHPDSRFVKTIKLFLCEQSNYFTSRPTNSYGTHLAFNELQKQVNLLTSF